MMHRLKIGKLSGLHIIIKSFKNSKVSANPMAETFLLNSFIGLGEPKI
jgi:hypothetical protein